MPEPPKPLGAAKDSIHCVMAVESLATLAFEPETSWYHGAAGGKYPPPNCVACRPVAPASPGGAPAPPVVVLPAEPAVPVVPVVPVVDVLDTFPPAPVTPLVEL